MGVTLLSLVLLTSLIMLPLATAKPGSVLGEVSLIDGKRCSAGCHAMGETILFSLMKSDFDSLFHANSPFAFRMTEQIALILSQRLRSAEEGFLSIFSHGTETIKVLEKRLDEIQSALEAGFSDDALLRAVKYRPQRGQGSS